MRMRYDREGDVLDKLVKEAQIHHAEGYGQIICYLADASSIHTQRWVKYFAERGHEVLLISYNPAHIIC